MEGLAVLVVVVLLLGWISRTDSSETWGTQPNVSTNEITYPSDIKCECGKEVEVTPETVDSSTWDLICECGKIGYKHPKREERMQQLNDMMNF
jgi:hypothetical protein